MITKIDLKTLKAIHILTSCGSVTKTADLMQVSPATISYLLNKARKVTGTALFCRTKKGMIPDSTAWELSNRYDTIMGKLRDGEDSTSLNNRNLTLSTYALIELMISSKLRNIPSFSKTLRFLTPELNDEARLIRLRNKEIDIDIGSKLPADKSIIQVDYISSEVSIIASKNHSTIGEVFTMKDWHENRHIVWSRGMSLTCGDIKHANRFNELVNTRNVAVISSNSLNMVSLCCYSDDILLMPKKLVSFLEERFPVKAFEPPEELKMRFDCTLHYHHTFVNDKSMLDILDIVKEM
ncbi:TPA: LysR family transcriptional regulator [Enterobacter hormaechei subsp. steigerwaltii]|nr:LysR family transcriptional regulator [Enterobacter hormaechei subsp. steigerwaltii]